MQLNTIKPAAGAKHAAPPRRPRHRFRPGQDRGTRPQRAEVAFRRLSQSRFRGRPDAAAAAPAQARLQFARARPDRRSAPVRPAENAACGHRPEGAEDAGVVPEATEAVKVILSGKLERKVSLSGLRVTKGARAAIEAAGGSIAAIEVKAPVGKGKKAKARVEAIAKAQSPGRGAQGRCRPNRRTRRRPSPRRPRRPRARPSRLPKTNPNPRQRARRLNRRSATWLPRLKISARPASSAT